MKKHPVQEYFGYNQLQDMNAPHTGNVPEVSTKLIAA